MTELEQEYLGIERWRALPIAGYSISSHGRVRGSSGKILKPTPNHGGYLRVRPYNAETGKNAHGVYIAWSPLRSSRTHMGCPRCITRTTTLRIITSLILNGARTRKIRIIAMLNKFSICLTHGSSFAKFES